MRIAHVVTLATADGRFGGPLTVARAQVGALGSRGHDVQLVAASDVTLRHTHERFFRSISLPGTGLAGTFAPGLLGWSLTAARKFDVIHIHLGRDLVTMPTARILASARVPFVVQTHGMVMPDRRLKSRAMDVAATRAVLRRAKTVFALTEHERAGVAALEPTAKIEQLPNGIDIGEPVRSEQGTNIGVPEVLFLARLHPRKRVSAFLDAAALLLARGSHARFVIVGPDEGDASLVHARLGADGRLSEAVTYEGSLPPQAARQRLSSSQIYVLPSVDEPFPMTVLEALASGVATVVTDSCHIAPELASAKAAVVSGPGPIELAAAIESLLVDHEYRDRVGAAGQAWVREHLSIESVVKRLEEVYEGGLV